MSEKIPRLVQLHRDGTVTVTLRPDEVEAFEGPRTRDAARFRCHVVSTDDLAAELAGITEVLPWLREVDRMRAVRDLHRMDAGRDLMRHVAGTPVAAFGPTQWTVVEIISGRWETDEPFRSDQLCAEGGMVFDAALPFTLGADDALMAELRTIPATDPRRRERVAIALDQHDDGLSAD